MAIGSHACNFGLPKDHKIFPRGIQGEKAALPRDILKVLFGLHITLQSFHSKEMDGKAFFRRQLLAGVRDHVSFIDECRVMYGFDRVVSLTPKVETRLRSGEHAKIPLQVQYTHEQVRLALVLTLQMDYPASPIEVQVLESGSGGSGTTMSDIGSEEGSEDCTSVGLGNDIDEEERATDTGADVRAANLVVLQQYLQSYCNSLVSTKEEEDTLKLRERMRELAEIIDAKTTDATAPPVMGVAAVAATRTASDSAFNTIVGVDVIKKFNELAMRCQNEELILDALGNVVAKVLPLSEHASEMPSLDVSVTAAEGGGESGEQNKGQVGKPLAAAPFAAELSAAAFKCTICRTLLFTAAHLEPHEPPVLKKNSKMAKDAKGKARIMCNCTSYFLAELFAPPLKEEVQAGELSAGLRRVCIAHRDDSGTLVCSKCNTKTGAWSWVGLQCSCQTWVCPAFMVNASKVDKCM